MATRRGLRRFAADAVRLVAVGGRGYYLWLGTLLVLIALGAVAYAGQLRHGLIVSHMRDQVSWAFYIGNFAFLVGVAAAAVMLVVPAYVYHWKPIKEIAVLGELLAVSALFMCMLFVMVDIGRPDRFWHLIPPLGTMNFPRSLLAWDVAALTGYLALNVFLAAYILHHDYHGRPYDQGLFRALVILAIPAAVSIHTVTAYLFNGLAARPFWNSAILAPRFLSSAFCSGPAILLVVFQILRRTTKLEIADEALFKVAELMAYVMGFYLFMTGAEAFKEFYSDTEDSIYMRYLYLGLPGERALVPFAWASLLSGVAAFALFVAPRTRRNFVTLNLGAALIFSSVFIEKGMGLIIPGMTPDTLGEVYRYVPSVTEVLVGFGILGLGFLLFTIIVRIAVPILTRDVTAPTPTP